MSGKISDLIAIAYGYIFANPEQGTLQKATTLISADLPISQGAIDEVFKLLAGVVVAVISRFAFAAIEKFKEKKQKKKDDKEKDNKEITESEQPDNINLN